MAYAFICSSFDDKEERGIDLIRISSCDRISSGVRGDGVYDGGRRGDVEDCGVRM